MLNVYMQPTDCDNRHNLDFFFLNLNTWSSKKVEYLHVFQNSIIIFIIIKIDLLHGF